MSQSDAHFSCSSLNELKSKDESESNAKPASLKDELMLLALLKNKEPASLKEELMLFASLKNKESSPHGAESILSEEIADYAANQAGNANLQCSIKSLKSRAKKLSPRLGGSFRKKHKEERSLASKMAEEVKRDGERVRNTAGKLERRVAEKAALQMSKVEMARVKAEKKAKQEKEREEKRRIEEEGREEKRFLEEKKRIKLLEGIKQQLIAYEKKRCLELKALEEMCRLEEKIIENKEKLLEAESEKKEADKELKALQELRTHARTRANKLDALKRKEKREAKMAEAKQLISDERDARNSRSRDSDTRDNIPVMTRGTSIIPSL